MNALPTLNDFLDYLGRASPAPRLVLFRDLADWENTRAWVLGENYRELTFASLLPAGRVLPDMIAILRRLEEEADKARTGLFATGLDRLLCLLDASLHEQAVYQLARWLERGSGRDILIPARHSSRIAGDLKKYSGSHRLKEGFRVAVIDGEDDWPETRIGLVSPELEPIYGRLFGPVYTLPQFLASREGSLPVDKPCFVLLDSPSWPVAGVNPDLPQHFELGRTLNELYEDKVDGLSAEAMRRLLNFAEKKNFAGSNFPKIPDRAILKNFFGDERPEVAILRRWRNLSPPEREILFRALPGIRAKDPDSPVSYLSAIRDLPEANPGNFERAYVEAWTIDNPAWAEERLAAIRNAGLENFLPAIELFAARSKNEPSGKIAPWLNCGTLPEKAELLRRCRCDGATRAILDVYPELAAYLAAEPDILDGYFMAYRELAVRNELNEDFMRRQAEARDKIPGFPARDTLLQSYMDDGALLVVDALGAEWLPMLLRLSRSMGLNVASAAVGRAALPTITSKNIFQWPEERRLPDIKSLDNVGHNGVEAHERRSVEENFAAMLEVPARICAEVKKALLDFPLAVVTGDHGASRLAALALEKSGFARKLEPLSGDCAARYCINGGTRNEAKNLTASLDGEYLCVNNYDYFSKSGRRSFAMHGGATPEEWLVTVVVFSSSEPPRPARPKAPQMTEDPDFDF
ncbi:MAG: BREX-4 system phosphatase PglZ [Desulfovibrio sp.]|nr:BREX-4 system phosphatase PglZ [Desulfovibrio sp.]